jgi:uncharacterized protein YfaS (alpha-2-macroglobulin family)
MTEQELDQLADDFLHNLLPPAEARDFTRRAAESPEYAAAVARARQRHDLLRTLPPAEPSTGLVEDTMNVVARHEAFWKAVRIRYIIGSIGGLVAAAVLLIFVGTYYAGLQAPGRDLSLLAQTQLFSDSRAALRVRLFDEVAQSPLVGEPVSFELIAPDGTVEPLGSAETDEHGNAAPSVILPDWPEGQYHLRVRGGGEELVEPIQLTRPLRVMLSTDKPIYQPGQTILMRSLALRVADMRPPVGEEAIFRLIDPVGNVLFRKARKTSEYGLASTQCPLDAEITEGAYVLSCTVGTTESKLTVEVKRYVLPKFNVEVVPHRPYYAPGETARVRVKAAYTFGKPVARAKVTVLMLTDAEREEGKQTVTADADGNAEVTFTVPKDIAQTGDARVWFAAAVTDTAGQKQTRATSRVVSAAPARLDVVPEAGELVPGVSNTIHILLRRPDGSPLPKVNIEAHIEDGAVVIKELTTDTTGAASFEAVPRDRSLAIAFRVHIAPGLAWEPRHTLWAGQGQGDFLLRPDRARYRAGDTLKLLLLGAGPRPVFVDVLRAGQTVLSQTVEMKNGRGELALDLPADLAGTLQLVAYRLAADGTSRRQERLIYVAPAAGLKVSAQLDQLEYRPGQTAMLRLSLRDNKGKPAPGAVSLVAVDEAVFAVQAQRPGMEQLFFTLDRELLQPVYSIYPWSPNEAPATGRERAAFAAASRNQGAQPQPRAARTYPRRKAAMLELRGLRLDQVRTGWSALAVLTVLLALGSLWLYLSVRAILQLAALIGVLVLGGFICLSSLSNLAPEAAGDRSMAKQGTKKDGPDWARFPAGRDGEKKDGEKKDGRDPEKKDEGPKDVRVVPGKTERPAPRVRKYFPETMFWAPQVISDEKGNFKPITIKLADSITTWRLSASGVTADGKLGSVVKPLKVFQPFFVELDLPTHLTRNDEVSVPVVVYSYLDKPQKVTLKIEASGGLELRGKAEAVLELGPNEVKSVRFPVVAAKVGEPKFKVTATAGDVADAIERGIRVEPDGRRVETVFNGDLAKPARHSLFVPKDAIEGSAYAEVKLYPSRFSQLVEGLEGIFQMPYGCFEQASSTTYPNVLALQYLKQSGMLAPKARAQAEHYIQLGYQRLVGFEVDGGGFDWYGKAPANIGLTAYGLMEFRDMAKVHPVDPELIARTRHWLRSKRAADGSWAGDRHSTSGGKLGTTAYVGWAVFTESQDVSDASKTREFLLNHRPASIKSPYVLALVCLALKATGASLEEASPYLDALANSPKDEGGAKISWRLPKDGRTAFYGAGPSGDVEATGTAALALLAWKRNPELVRKALAWLASNKDAHGTWGSTQATVMALKAIVAGSSAPAEEKRREFVVSVNGTEQTVSIAAADAEVMARVPLRNLKPGANAVVVRDKTKTAASYQVVFRYYVPNRPPVPPTAPLLLAVNYSRNKLEQGGEVKATAKVTNNTDAELPMVMLELPVPPGFSADTSALDELVKKEAIGRYQAEPRRILVYLRRLAGRKSLEVEYTLKARLAVKAEAPPARAWEYYDPSKEVSTAPVRFESTAK